LMKVNIFFQEITIATQVKGLIGVQIDQCRAGDGTLCAMRAKILVNF
jgi:hypothetical protein